MKQILILLVLTYLGCITFATPDTPQTEETFPTFFARLTHGGNFPGIYINPPDVVQNSFLSKIKKSYWVNLNNLEKRNLKTAGIDLWQDWYIRKNPAALLFPSSTALATVEIAYTNLILKNPKLCVEKCPLLNELLGADWDSLPIWKQQLLTFLFVLEAPVYQGNTMISYLTKLYDLQEAQVKLNADIRILNHAEFVAGVRELGWEGLIYFRGITGPDPANPLRHWILIDAETIGKNSPFDSTLLRMLEISGIVMHELSHVCQDLRGKQINSKVEVNSAEDALILEGLAEYFSEKAILNAGSAVEGVNPWHLFVREQGSEIIYREGNENRGNLFPYTVGLPFVTSLFSVDNKILSDTALRDELLKFLDATNLAAGKPKEPLEAMLRRTF